MQLDGTVERTPPKQRRRTSCLELIKKLCIKLFPYKPALTTPKEEEGRPPLPAGEGLLATSVGIPTLSIEKSLQVILHQI